MEPIGETVSVIVLFGPPHMIKPLRFLWRGRTCMVSEITYHWKSREGLSVLQHFSVTDGSTLYQLTFNSMTLRWSLDAVEV